MHRDLKAMSRIKHDLIVVGGGVTGASVAWDAALRGLKVALVEKDDFAHATTSGSSKLIHGGLRYLVNGELGLVRESLRERRIWEVIAPHMVTPLPFILPTYGRGLKGKLVLSIGLAFYDLLSYDRNWLADDDKKLPGYQTISRAQALELMPSLRKEGLTGAKIYYDCQMFAPERMCLEMIQGAAEYGAHVANYAQAVGFEIDASLETGARVKAVQVQDRLTGETHEIKGDLVINAAGPWADKMMGLADDGPPARGLIRSKGIHLITDNLSGDKALAVQSKIGGHFFVLPWRNHTIFGTTDTVYDGDPDKVGVSEQDITDFLDVINDGLPGLDLKRQDIRHFYVGIRPLVDTTPPEEAEGDDKDSYNASRAAEIVDHKETDALDGLLSAMGGKWTTSRHLAEQIVDKAYEKLERSKAPCQTHCTPLYGGEIGRYRSFVERAIHRHQSLPRDVVENLCRFYGARIDEVLATGNERPETNAACLARLDPERPDLAVGIIHAVRHEMAQNLEDVVFRRTGLGTLGAPGAALKEAARLMAAERGWDDAEQARQIAAVEAAFKPQTTAKPGAQ